MAKLPTFVEVTFHGEVALLSKAAVLGKVALCGKVGVLGKVAAGIIASIPVSIQALR